MYTIKNISSKIIHIGTTILMPDATMKTSEAIAKSPAIKALANRKMLEITAPAVEAPKVEQSAQTADTKVDDQQSGEGEGEDDGESETDQAPAVEAPKDKGARRTAKKAADTTKE